MPKNKDLVVVQAQVDVPDAQSAPGGVFGDLSTQFKTYMDEEAKVQADVMSEIVAVVRGTNAYLKAQVLTGAQKRLEDVKAFARAQGLDE